ncbi:MAG: hypothetical protein ACP5NB_10895 [Chloroflexia bacterium]
MMPKARKLSFPEIWETLTIFFVDEGLEQEIDQEVERLLAEAERYGAKNLSTPEELATLLQDEGKGPLEFVLHEIGLSQEKFLRIISLLRKVGVVSVPLGPKDKEWTMEQIVRRICQDRVLAAMVAQLLMDGVRDHRLQDTIPRYYLETLNFRELTGVPDAVRRTRYKHALIGTYSGRKGYRVESLIQKKLEGIQRYDGVGYERGRSLLIATDIDFALPKVEDPWVVIMCSFQETTSSGQSTKARDMPEAYDRIRHINFSRNESRVFVNFIDGGGWLARKGDLKRLVEHCDYALNLRHLDMLEAIVRQHIPDKYFQPPSLISAYP